MANVLKHKIDTDFTVVSNILLKSCLSAKAKGIFVQIISLPEDWNFSIKGLSALFSDKETSIKSGIDELIETGFIKWEKHRDKNSRFSVTVTTQYPKKPYGKTSTGEKPVRENKDNKEYKDKERKLNKEHNNIMDVAKSDDSKVGSLYYKVIKKYNLPVTNHNVIKSKIKQMEQENAGGAIETYLGFLLATDYSALNFDMKPTLSEALHIYTKRVAIENALRRLKDIQTNKLVEV